MRNNILETSKRLYSIAIVDNGNISVMQSSLKEIEEASMGHDYEWAHSLMEYIDDTLNLSLGHSMYFQPNRDDSTSKGIVLRIR